MRNRALRLLAAPKTVGLLSAKANGADVRHRPTQARRSAAAPMRDLPGVQPPGCTRGKMRNRALRLLAAPKTVGLLSAKANGADVRHRPTQARRSAAAPMRDLPGVQPPVRRSGTGAGYTLPPGRCPRRSPQWCRPPRRGSRSSASWPR